MLLHINTFTLVHTFTLQFNPFIKTSNFFSVIANCMNLNTYFTYNFQDVMKPKLNTRKSIQFFLTFMDLSIIIIF